VLVSLAAAIVCGARSVLEAERLQAHQVALFGAAPSDSTTRRTLAGLDEAMLARLAKARAKVRRHVWHLLHLRPGGFLAERRGQAAEGMDRHRHRRHHHHRLFRQGRGGGHVQENVRLSPAGLLVLQHPGIAGDAATGRERRQ
jgi:hypothetical protein